MEQNPLWEAALNERIILWAASPCGHEPALNAA
jgi:hypothetical protein